MTLPKTQCEKEKILNQMRLVGWSPDLSPSKQLLTQLYGKYNRTFLQALAKLIQEECQLYLDREAQRRKDVLYKWFDENLSVIEPYLKNHLCVTDSNFNPIGNQTKESLSLLQQHQTNKN